jgi:3-hydroxybutyryl-CoA dehydrogenase
MPADNSQPIEHVAVVGGGGLMGSGIAQVVAQSGLQVTAIDLDPAALARGRARIEKGLGRAVGSGKLDAADGEAALARITFSSSLEDAADAAHVIESVIEALEVKLEVLARLDEICDDGVVFASNTSQFSISRLAAGTKRAPQVIGSHWFNPPPVMGLIELVRGVETSDETLATCVDLGRRYGKQTIVCKKDTPGFITSRLIALLIVEAARIVEEGIADAEDVDTACRLAFNHPLGPLDTADLSGLDTVARVADALRESYGDRFLVPQVLRSLVNAGHYGRKTGRGFRRYDEAT